LTARDTIDTTIGITSIILRKADIPGAGPTGVHEEARLPGAGGFRLTACSRFNTVGSMESSRKGSGMTLEENVVDYFRSHAPGTVAVYLFGSQASGKLCPTSDVDIAVLFDRTDRDFIHARMEEILQRLPRLLRKDVHPVAMNSAGEVLLKQILSKGKCIVVNDARKLAEFQMKAFSRIADFNYYLKRMQSGLVRSVLDPNIS
jgi:predicted nucleotidyltransferase